MSYCSKLNTCNIHVQTSFTLRSRAISRGPLPTGYNHYHLKTSSHNYHDDDDDDNDDNISIIYWTLTWCQLPFYVFYIFSHLILATIYWGSCSDYEHLQLRKLKHRWLGNLPKITQRRPVWHQYSHSKAYAWPCYSYVSCFWGELQKAWAKNGIHVANQNNQILLIFETFSSWTINLPAIFLESNLAL